MTGNTLIVFKKYGETYNCELDEGNMKKVAKVLCILKKVKSVYPEINNELNRKEMELVFSFMYGMGISNVSESMKWFGLSGECIEEFAFLKDFVSTETPYRPRDALCSVYCFEYND